MYNAQKFKKDQREHELSNPRKL
jgi:hypothetical protein